MSKMYNPDPVIGSIIAETDDFVIALTTIPADRGDPVVVYGIYNRHTDVREGEVRTLAGAQMFAAQLQEQADEDRELAEADMDLREALGEAEADDENYPVPENPIH